MRGLRNNQEGALSITALWMLAILALLAMELSKNVMLALRMDAYAVHENQATWLAKSGVFQAISVLQKDALQDTLGWDGLHDAWADNPALFQHVTLGSGFFQVAYAADADAFGKDNFYGIEDENRKINLNLAPPKILARLPGMTSAKLAALLDWIDADDKVRENGAEDGYYMKLPSPYHCKNAKLDDLGELTQVRGFSADDVRLLSSIATVHSDGSVNINTAAPQVLQMLGLRQESAKKILTVRWGEDRVPFSGDDVIFKKPEKILPRLLDKIKLSAGEQVALQRLVTSGRLSTRSTHFTIRAVGVTMNGQVRKIVTAVVRRDPTGEIEIVSWTE